jgi:microcystin degradation protein MlrC
MTKRLAVARLWLEVNSFSPVPTTAVEFSRCEWNQGPDAFERYRGTRTEMGAVAAFADNHPDWDVSVLRAASAPPGGPMDDSLFNQWVADVTGGLKNGKWDAVYLSLHGATMTPTHPHAEAALVKAVRGVIGRTPLGASFDMHANLGEPLIAMIDVTAGYKTLPHIDMFETAEKVLSMLLRVTEGTLHPVRAILRPGCILHSFFMRTSDGPMAEIEAIARAEEGGPILDVTPYGGFPYTDGPFTGSSVVVCADGNGQAAQKAAMVVCEAIRARAQRFAVDLPDAEAGLRRALELGHQPIAVLESADNTYSGGIGDTPGLFAALRAVAPDVPSLFAFFCDVDLVQRAHQAGVGAEISCKLGASVTHDFGKPVPVTAKVVRFTDGKFTNIGPMETGVKIDMGRTVVLRVGACDVIVTESRQPVNDPAYFTMHGIDLSQVRLLCVKAKNHFRAGLGPFCKGFIEVDTPGPAAIDLRSLPFRYAPVADIV